MFIVQNQLFILRSFDQLVFVWFLLSLPIESLDIFRLWDIKLFVLHDLVNIESSWGKKKQFLLNSGNLLICFPQVNIADVSHSRWTNTSRPGLLPPAKRLHRFHLLTGADRNRKPQSSTTTTPQKKPVQTLLTSHLFLLCSSSGASSHPRHNSCLFYCNWQPAAAQESKRLRTSGRESQRSARRRLLGHRGAAPFIIVGCSGCVNLIMLLLFLLPSSSPLQMIPAPELDPGRWAVIPLRLRSWPGSWVTTPSTPHTTLALIHAWHIALVKVFLWMLALCDVIRGGSPLRGYGEH